MGTIILDINEMSKFVGLKSFEFKDICFNEIIVQESNVDFKSVFKRTIIVEGIDFVKITLQKGKFRYNFLATGLIDEAKEKDFMFILKSRI